MIKQLSIAIPSYNSEQYIRKCMDSMVDVDPRLEIIVVNDGSSDSTGEIAEEYARKYPDQVYLINKENGGHGSGINAAVYQANGRYFKVVDSDDWIVTANLKQILDKLERTTADAVITGYHTVNMTSGKTMAFSSACKYAGQEITIEQMLEVYEEISSCCSFHGLMYRTEMYRDEKIKLSEGIFYEDQEYATIPFAHVERVLILEDFFYEYLIGNANQSVAFHNQVKRIDHIEAVIRRIIEYRGATESLTAAQEEYFQRKLTVVTVSYFAVALVKDTDRKRGFANSKRFYQDLSILAPEILDRISKKYKTLVILHRLHFPADLYQGILDTRIYKAFRGIWIN